MPAAPTTPTATAADQREFRVDSLAVGMIVMLAMTVVGRGIGFVRGMAFCRLMSDTDVGRWSMAFGFITLITPVMLLGIPGVLPKFTEYFRVRGQLSSFVRRIAIGTTACTLVFVLAMIAAPSYFGYIVFLQAESAALMNSMAGAVAAVIFYNFISDLNGSLRQVKMVSVMQFIHGVGFTILSVSWLLAGGGFIGIIWMFSLACLSATLPGLWSLSQRWTEATATSKHESNGNEFDTLAEESRLGRMVRRLAPYAFALWMANLIGNLFELSDRYMILHFMPLPAGTAESAIATVREAIGQAAVGQYHSGRIVPTMLLSVGFMVAGILVPYLSTDWEARKFEAVRSRVKDMLLALCLLFTLGSGVAILLGPFMFETLLQGRYSDGMQLMPMALCFCTWNALVCVGQCYLLTAEKGRAIAIAMAAGLATNLVLNTILLPRMGLTGAVIATLLSHSVVMLGHWFAMVHVGYDHRRGLLLVSLLPISLLISPWLAIGLSLFIAIRIAGDPTMRESLLGHLPERAKRFLPA